MERESHLYAQSYPGALISGETARLQGPAGPISDHCTAGGPERRASCSRSSSDSRKSSSPQSDGAASLPATQQQTDSWLPLSTAHARSGRTPPPSSRSTPDEIEATADDRACDDDASRSMGVRPRSLQERLELAKIPLGQLVRQTRDRLNEAKGCDISESRVCTDRDGIAVAHTSAPPTRPTTLSCDIADPAENTSNRQSQTKRLTATSLPPSPNRLAPPCFKNPFLSSHSYPNRLATSFNDLSDTGSSHLLNDSIPQSADTSKEYEVCFLF